MSEFGVEEPASDRLVHPVNPGLGRDWLFNVGAGEGSPGAKPARGDPESEVGGEGRRLPGPEAAEDGPRVGGEGGDEAAGQVGLVELAGSDRDPHRLHPGLPAWPVGVRAKDEPRERRLAAERHAHARLCPRPDPCQGALERALV